MRSLLAISSLYGVLLVACSGPADAPLDPDARVPDVVDAEPPPPDPRDEPLPVCIELPNDPTSCRECLAGPPLQATASACSEAVCALDSSCCETMWDDRCVRLADQHCEIAECLNTVTFTGGWASLLAAQWVGTEVRSDAWTNFPDSVMVSGDWADYDGNGFADVAAASDCSIRILRGQGWSDDQLAVGSAFREDLMCSTETGAYGTSARWVDVDGDGDLDVVASHTKGAFWIRQQAGQFTRAADLVPYGSASIAAIEVGDLDRDRNTDVVAMVWRTDPATGNQNQTLERFEWDDTAGFVAAAADWGVDRYYSGVTALRWCDLAGDGERELLFVGWLHSYAHLLFNGVLGHTVMRLEGLGTSVTCANLDDDPRDEIILNHAAEGAPADLKIIKGNVVVWQSSVDLAPGFTINAGGVAALDLDHDGDLDLVVGGNEQDDGVITVLRRQPGPALTFTVETVGDLLAGHYMHAAQAVHLPRLAPTTAR